MIMISRTSGIVAVLVGVAAVVVLSACAGSADPAADADHDRGLASSGPLIDAAPAGFNDDDVGFVTRMIPHHQQAVELAALVPVRSANADVIELAQRISAEQGPEIETMKVFLVQWKEGAVNPAAPTGHDGHGANMPGAVDEATTAELESLTGSEFDRLWLESMIGHHQAAIAMAKTEIANGTNVDAVALAQTIVGAQQAEIDQMKQMLGG